MFSIFSLQCWGTEGTHVKCTKQNSRIIYNDWTSKKTTQSRVKEVKEDNTDLVYIEYISTSVKPVR